MKLSNSKTIKSLVFIVSNLSVSIVLASTPLDCYNYARENTINKPTAIALCKGAPNEMAPADCYNQMRWASFNRLSSEDRVKLCSGSEDAELTIDCFTKARSSYTRGFLSVDEAIELCSKN